MLTVNDKICLNISLAGYPTQGEAVIINISVDEHIVYSALIDCFEEDDSSVVDMIISKHEIKEFDMICWTHPDRDHTIGFHKYFPMLNKDGVIVLPSGINQQIDRIKEEFPDVYEVIEKNEKLRLNNGSKRESIRASAGTIIDTKFSDGFCKGTTVYEFFIKCFSPVDAIVNAYEFGGVERKPNDFSIGLWIQLGEATTVLTADINELTIKRLKKSFFPQYIDYFKIPHHGSQYSLKILEYFDKTNVACTTTNSYNHLPDDITIDKYKLVSDEIYSTGTDGSDRYGIVEISIDITDDELHISNQLCGNAIKLK